MSNVMRRFAALGAAAAAVTAVSIISPASAYVAPDVRSTAAVPANSVGSGQVINNSLNVQDQAPAAVTYYKTPGLNTVTQNSIRPNVVTEDKLSPGTRAKLNATTGQVSKVETDGPYPGRTDHENDLQNIDGGSQGAQSTALWAAGTDRRQSWVMCAPGKVALGGGFGDNDGDDSKIRVVTSTPAQVVKNGANYELAYSPIAGDPAGSFLPNAWLVEGFNEGTDATMVRPWVICVKVG